MTSAPAWNGEPPEPDRPGWYWLRDRRADLLVVARWLPIIRPALIGHRPLRGWQMTGRHGIRPPSSMAAAGWIFEGEATPPAKEAA